jgi:hypothetical protein
VEAAKAELLGHALDPVEVHDLLEVGKAGIA